LLVDDHSVLRAGPCLLLSSQPDLAVAGDARDALALAESLQPDLILLDLTMPGLSGIEALPALSRLAPAALILVLTMHDDESYLRQALRKGAAGYVLKKAADSELISAIQAVLRGEVYVRSALTRALLNDLVAPADKPSPDTTRDELWRTLSEREAEVLRLVARGHINAEIAERLSLSAKTVETYRGRGMERLGLRARATDADGVGNGHARIAACPVACRWRCELARRACNLNSRGRARYTAQAAVTNARIQTILRCAGSHSSCAARRERLNV
jgi:DNA-binding NarL/FixJ family response regulator